MDEAESFDPAELLSQAGWVRRLAGRLLRDPAAADDVTQEALAAALQGAPRSDRSLRSWLGGVVRKLVHARLRAEANRSQREADARLLAPSPSAVDVVERGESFRLVVQAVFELPEPYRSTILMRYFDGLSTAQIAEQTGASRGAIRTRHSRGLALLREELDRRHGGDARTWLTALAPLALPIGTPSGARPAPPSSSFPRPALPVVATGGALLMSTKALLATATVVLVLGGLWLRSERVTPATAASPPPETIAAESPALQQLEKGTREPASGRVGIAAQPVETEFVHPPVPGMPGFLLGSVHIRGEVIDLSGQPVEGVAVNLRTAAGEPQPLAESGSDGSFEIPNDGRYGTLEAGNEQYAPVFNAVFAGFGRDARGLGQNPLTLVVAARAYFEGHVVDAEGLAIAAAEIETELPSDFRMRFDAILDNSIPAVPRVETDAQGHFSLEAGCVPGSLLIAHKDDYPGSQLELPATSALDLQIVLSREDQSLLLGQVTDVQARPVVGAKVAFGWQAAISDADGRFQFDLEDDSMGDWDPQEVVALHPGFLPTRVQEASQPDGEWGRCVTLVFSEEPHSIAGKVLHPNGDPVAGADLYILNPLFFGPARQGEGDSLSTADVEQLLNDNTRHNAPLATTSADGSFVLKGLLAREYKLHAMEPTTLTRATSVPISAPATGIVMQLERPELTPIAGRVVDRYGDPLPNLAVAVNIVRTVDRQGLPYGGGFPEYFRTQYSAMTGLDGRFAFPEMDPTYVRLQISSSGLVAVFHHDLATAAPPLDDMEIVAYRRCHFFVEFEDQPDLADSFQLLDESGEVVDIVRGRGNRTMHADEAQLRDGRSETVSASERARTLVLYKAGEIVQRVPIELTPDETQRIGP